MGAVAANAQGVSITCSSSEMLFQYFLLRGPALQATGLLQMAKPWLWCQHTFVLNVWTDAGQFWALCLSGNGTVIQDPNDTPAV